MANKKRYTFKELQAANIIGISKGKEIAYKNAFDILSEVSIINKTAQKLKPAGYLPICTESEYPNEIGQEWPVSYAWTLKMAKCNTYDFSAERKFRYIKVYAKVSDLKHKTSGK